MGSGSADLTSPPAWMNSINNTYVTADVLASTTGTITRFSPLDSKMWWCAATPSSQVVLIGPQYLQIFSLSNPNTPVYSARTVCSVLNWAGSVSGRSLFFHARSAECNCADLATKPCPIGMTLQSSQGAAYVTPYTASFGPYFLSGRDYEESISTTDDTQTIGTSLTWDVEPVFYNDSALGLVFPTYQPCANGTVTIAQADYPRFANKWVLVGPLHKVVDCGSPNALYAFLGTINVSGVLLEEPQGSLAYPGNPLPYLGLGVTYEMGHAIVAAWNASICAATSGCVVYVPTVATPTKQQPPPPNNSGVEALRGSSALLAILVVAAFVGKRQ